MQRSLIATVSVGALVFGVYLAVGGNVRQQQDFLADAGYDTPTHVATCPVLIAKDCVNYAQDAGINVHTYERLRFPVIITPDGGYRDVQLPPMPLSIILGRRCVDVIDWSDCTLQLASAAPAVAAKWGNTLPFATGVNRKCVRPNYDAGVMCARALSDGGWFYFGDRNVFPRAEAQNPLDCEQVECTIFAGDDPERDL
jgi:hypothetical protein